MTADRSCKTSFPTACLTAPHYVPEHHPVVWKVALSDPLEKHALHYFHVITLGDIKR